jgi:hypothetical protein
MSPNVQEATAVGVFETRAAAERAVDDLKAAGYRDDQIGLVAMDAEERAAESAGAGAATGAAAGAGAAALTSLGISFGVIPAIGPILAVGPLAAALFSAAGGAAAGGVAGALVGFGVTDEDAKYYEAEVQAGRYLVTVDRGARLADARSVLTRHGGYDRTAGANRK